MSVVAKVGLVLLTLFSFSLMEEDDDVIYASIADLAKTMKTVEVVKQSVEHLHRHYENHCNVTSRLLHQLAQNQYAVGEVLNPAFFVKSILNINRFLAMGNDYTNEVENLQEDLSRLARNKERVSEISVNKHMRVLFFLQDFYDISAQRIAEGFLGPIFSALDCYEIGAWAFKRQDAYHARMWLHEAENRLNKPPIGDVTPQKVFLKLASIYAVYKRNELVEQYVNDVLKIDPKNLGARQFQVILQEPSSYYNQVSGSYKTGPRQVEIWKGKNLHQLCQKEQLPNLERLPICTYTGSGYYRNKLEIFSYYPAIFGIHGILTDKEIHSFHQQASIQNMKSSLNISTIINSKANTVIANFKKKMQKAFLRTENAHLIYTHFDFGELHPPVLQPLKTGQTFEKLVKKKGSIVLMAFLNNVKGGGRVVFPALNFSVQPRRKFALMWGLEEEKSDRLFHTVCPIYSGNETVVYMVAKK